MGEAKIYGIEQESLLHATDLAYLDFATRVAERNVNDRLDGILRYLLVNEPDVVKLILMDGITFATTYREKLKINPLTALYDKKGKLIGVKEGHESTDVTKVT